MMPDEAERIDATNFNMTDAKEYKKVATVYAMPMDEPFSVRTLGNVTNGKAGDYLVQGTRGERWPVKKAIFKETYEPIESETLAEYQEAGALSESVVRREGRLFCQIHTLGREVEITQGDLIRITKLKLDETPKIVCLCGSGRFKDAFDEAEFNETLAGNIVLTIGCNTKDVARSPMLAQHKPMLDELHLRKIDLADEVLILNVDGYIGESTANELAYAKACGKTIRFLEEPDNEEILRAKELCEIILARMAKEKSFTGDGNGI